MAEKKKAAAKKPKKTEWQKQREAVEAARKPRK